jgi:hypothetical protein
VPADHVLAVAQVGDAIRAELRFPTREKALEAKRKLRNAVLRQDPLVELNGITFVTAHIARWGVYEDA